MLSRARRYEVLRGLILHCLQLHDEVELHSGLVSPYFIDVPLLLSRPYLLDGLLHQLINLFIHIKEDFVQGIISPDFGGTLIAVALQQALQECYHCSLPIYRYLKTGTFENLPLYLSAKSFVLFDDVITSGSSVMPIIDFIEDRNASIIQVVTVVNRQEGGGERILSERGITLSSLFTLDEILAFAKKNPKI